MELPRLQPLFDGYKDQGFTVVVVEGKRQTELAKSFIEKHGLTYPALENGDGDAEVVKTIFGVQSFPTSFLIDREGRIMFAHVGFSEGDEERLAEDIERLLE